VAVVDDGEEPAQQIKPFENLQTQDKRVWNSAIDWGRMDNKKPASQGRLTGERASRSSGEPGERVAAVGESDPFCVGVVAGVDTCTDDEGISTAGTGDLGTVGLDE
jgi:hypothetical protein